MVNETGEGGASGRGGGGAVLGKYELGRTIGEGNFGKVKYARHVGTGIPFAIKILDRKRILEQKIDDRIKSEIGTLKLLKHPNIVRLHEVAATKTKIYMVMEYIDGGELFDKIAVKKKLSERVARKLFQQLIDGVSYCHESGVYHRDLKPENVLVDANGNIKISDFGLSALPQHLGADGLLHTTCGSPNYIAPEVVANRGYNGQLSDIWSCGVILYVMLVGYLPFDDRNLAVLYQKIFKGDTEIPKWLSSGAQNLIKRILDPNPITRIDIAGIKADPWFKKDYTPIGPLEDDDDMNRDTGHLEKETNDVESYKNYAKINAFRLISMSSSLDLSGFFEKEGIYERKIVFTSNHSAEDLFQKIEEIVTEMGFAVVRKNKKIKVMHQSKGSSLNKSIPILVAAEVFEVHHNLCIVELSKSYGEPSLYRELCSKLSADLGICTGPRTASHDPEASTFQETVNIPPQ